MSVRTYRQLLIRWLLGALSGALLPGAIAAPGDALEAIDARGQSIMLAQPARRIVSLAPHVTELLFAAGAGKQIVAAVAYSDYPPAARRIPRIGDTHGIDLERIVALRPDLVVAWHRGTPANRVAPLEALGIPVFFDGAGRLDEIADAIGRLGRLAGTTHMANAAADLFRNRLADLRARYQGRRPVRVFHQVWNDPLMSINGTHLISDVIKLCGGLNVFAAERTLVPRIAREAVVLANPELITTAASDQNEDALAGWRRWPSISAVSNKRLISLPGDPISRLSPRVLDGAQSMCEAIDASR